MFGDFSVTIPDIVLTSLLASQAGHKYYHSETGDRNLLLLSSPKCSAAHEVQLFMFKELKPRNCHELNCCERLQKLLPFAAFLISMC